MVLLGLLSVVGFCCATSAVAAEPEINFDRQIRPLLSNQCYKCHGPDEKARQAELRFDQREAALAELPSGKRAVVPGKLDQSELIQRITSTDADLKMPPADSGKQLTAAQIELFRRWIEAGAKWEEHWAYRPPHRSAPPAVQSQAWVRNPIDQFLLARLEQEQLAPSPEADRRTLARRLSFDLLGLPPTAAEVEAFVADGQPEAYERLVDRLLTSPHYGERLAIYWLDLVRYADTVGYHGDQNQNISRYRDWVIQAFNDNLPFDQFTLKQIAGDLLPGATLEDRIASGYNRLYMTTEEGGAQPLEYLAKYSADRVRNTSAVWLGATLACAECHDHKFDPYTAKDFYRFAAFFADLEEVGKYSGTGGRPPEIKAPTPAEQTLLNNLRARQEELARYLNEKKDLPAGVKELTQNQLTSVQAELAALEKRIRLTMVSVSVPPREIRVLHRGNWQDTTGEIVTPGVPGFLPPLATASQRATRLDLAQWLIAKENPLPARVFVNRMWRQFFGAGLSKSLDDLGAQGEPPVHPELLDWLAVEFMESGWDIKHLVRLLVTSSAYRQSSLMRPELQERDPFNRLIARQSRFRLQAEMIRDNALAVSGLLVRTIGGSSVHPYQPAGYYQHLNFPTRSYLPDRGEAQYRRGLYTHWQRTFLHPALLAFDAPSREECTAERLSSNTPKGALALLNDPSQVEAARALAARIIKAEAADPIAHVNWAVHQVLSRPAEPREAEVLLALYQDHLAHYQQQHAAAEALSQVGDTRPPEGTNLAELAAWTNVARALLNLNETITRN